MNNVVALDVVLPVYNEEKCLEIVLWELYREIQPKVPMRFIISEDGSTDRTKAILYDLRHKLPIELLTGARRMGYSQAMIQALKKTTAPYVLCIDSDGQYNPKDFWKLWNRRTQSSVVIGNRKRRVDSALRIFLSRLFYLSFYSLFTKGVHDPSCSFILMRSRVPEKLTPILGLTNEGFWWEFMARVKQYGFTVTECVVRHRARRDGVTKVYAMARLPSIAWRHMLAMIHIAQSGPKDR